MGRHIKSFQIWQLVAIMNSIRRNQLVEDSHQTLMSISTPLEATKLSLWSRVVEAYTPRTWPMPTSSTTLIKDQVTSLEQKAWRREFTTAALTRASTSAETWVITARVKVLPLKPSSRTIHQRTKTIHRSLARRGGHHLRRRTITTTCMWALTAKTQILNESQANLKFWLVPMFYSIHRTMWTMLLRTSSPMSIQTVSTIATMFLFKTIR